MKQIRNKSPCELNSYPHFRMSKTALGKVKTEAVKIGSASLKNNQLIEI